MLYDNNLLASLPEAWYANASEPDCRWRRLRGAQASLNLRFHNWKQGTATPALETLWSLCVALDIPFARLLEPQVQKTQVIRRGEGTKVVAEQAHYQAILLAACPPGARRDIYLLLTQRGADRISHPHPPGSVEHIIVTPGKSPRRLNRGAGRAGGGRLHLLSRRPGAYL
ncbi:putative DNA-binding protein [Salmonella enterica subsp. enterica]|uniref:Putative DNA-binding protein n=1 Tax=Salmonella enterica I TaxID=59201 RepID=A0A379WIM6_SALET|nr:putative DNA-binding protein [Salmonella enterica subsp. enterica]